MEFLTEPEPPRLTATAVAPGIRRIVAPNPGAMTYHGTNTYLIDSTLGTVVLDPGPADPAHLEAIVRAAGEVAAIVVSHTHRDHLAGVAPLQALTGAPTMGFRKSAEAGFAPAMPLDDGAAMDDWTAIHTPGHAADHLCLARADGVVFSGDHVMSFSTSIVSPPGGDMAAYMASLRRLLAREDGLYLPGHGPPIHAPLAFARGLLEHRLAREAAVLRAIVTPASIADIVGLLYAEIAPLLRPAAARNVLAHLLKLQGEGRAVQEGEVWRAS